MIGVIEQHYRNNFHRWVKKLSQQHGWHNAEDIVQNIYVRALEQKEPIQNMDRWFISQLKWRQRDHMTDEKKIREGKEALIHSNEAVSLTPKKADTLLSKPAEVNDAVPDPIGSPEELLNYLENASLIQEMITRKSEKTAGILTAVFLWGNSYEEAARREGVSNMAVRKAVERFRHELKDSGIFG